ncbi:MAG TPA: cytochrome c3 family protein [Dehalococcoidia bacterium]|nr:cytochrome c3 family protein [Dehalococcoidia bacterium]
MSTPARVCALAGVIALVLLAVGVGGVLGEEKNVSGTKHDVATGGTPPCVYCHIQRDGAGELLYARDPNSVGSYSGLKPLCFSCHDGTVAPLKSFVFDLTRPDHPSSPGVRGQDCTRCHDPHESGYGKFLKLPGGADFCRNCHFRAGPTDHPVDIEAAAAGIRPADSHWDPESGDFSGTRLWNAAGTGPGGFVKCLSCHSPHGAEPDTAINTVAVSPWDRSSMPLCQSCHGSGGRGD